jgi:hemoglobin-like flavoprotein|tara:strand:- start:56 stop:481 length:426 start_codon:yes stop_codon:yes gene_type:complete
MRTDMTPEQIEIVQSTFKKVAPISDAAADIFYDRLFLIAPDTRALFPEVMTDQKKKLMQMIGIAVNGLTNLEAIVPAVQDLGARHNGYNVTDAHYDSVGAALLFALSQGLGEDFTPEAEAAWAETYGLLASVMKEAQHAAA